MFSCGRFKSVNDMIHANRYRKMKLPIPVVTIFFLSDLGYLIFIPFAITQVTRKRMIMKPIDVHLCSSSCSIPSKRNVAATPPIMENTTRSQKSLVSFFLIFFVSASVVKVSSGSVGGVLSFWFGLAVHLPVGCVSSFWFALAVHLPVIHSSESDLGSGSGSTFSIEISSF